MTTIVSTYLSPPPPTPSPISPGRNQTPCARRQLGHSPPQHQNVRPRLVLSLPRPPRPALPPPPIPPQAHQGPRSHCLPSSDLLPPLGCVRLVYHLQVLPGRGAETTAGRGARQARRVHRTRGAAGEAVVEDRGLRSSALHGVLCALCTPAGGGLGVGGAWGTGQCGLGGGGECAVAGPAGGFQWGGDEDAGWGWVAGCAVCGRALPGVCAAVLRG